MTAISRRIMLGGFAATAGGVIATSIPLPETSKATDEHFDLQHWLDTADPKYVAQYHAARLTEVMSKVNPSRAYHAKFDHLNEFVLIVGDPIDVRRAPVAKVRFDDGSPLFADDVTGTTAFADWEASR